MRIPGNPYIATAVLAGALLLPQWGIGLQLRGGGGRIEGPSRGL